MSLKEVIKKMINLDLPILHGIESIPTDDQKAELAFYSNIEAMPNFLLEYVLKGIELYVETFIGKLTKIEIEDKITELINHCGGRAPFFFFINWLKKEKLVLSQALIDRYEFTSMLPKTILTDRGLQTVQKIRKLLGK